MATSSGDARSLAELARVGSGWCNEAVIASDGAGLSAPCASTVRSLLDRARSLVGEQRRTLAQVRTVAAGFDLADRARERRAGDALVNRRTADVAEQIRELKRLGALDQRTLERLAITGIAGGRLLSFESGADGRIVEVLGDLATAAHVAVLIPGMSNDLDNYVSSHRKKATSLLAEMQARAKPGETVAVISWLGYDTPDGLVQAARSNLAISGAKQLRRDLAFVNAANPRAHVTVIGHSYGSVVLGQAMKRGLPARDAIAAGSPGMDASDRSELGSPTVTLWATRVRGRDLKVGGHKIAIVPADVVPFAPGHGEDPAAPGFHANKFRADGVTSHGGYFNPGTGSLIAMAEIATATRARRKRNAKAAQDRQRRAA